MYKCKKCETVFEVKGFSDVRCPNCDEIFDLEQIHNQKKMREYLKHSRAILIKEAILNLHI